MDEECRTAEAKRQQHTAHQYDLTTFCSSLRSSLSHILTLFVIRFAHRSKLSASPTILGVIVGIFLQPRNDKPLYYCLLTIQVICAFIAPEVVQLGFIKMKSKQVVIALVRIFFSLALASFLFFARSKVANLPTRILSNFLTDKLFVPAISTTIIVVFLGIDPVRCYMEVYNERKAEQGEGEIW